MIAKVGWETTVPGGNEWRLSQAGPWLGLRVPGFGSQRCSAAVQMLREQTVKRSSR